MTKNCLAFAAVLIRLSGRPCQAADGLPTSESWYVYADHLVKYGSQHCEKRQLADGSFEYHVESRVLLDLPGNRQEESTKATYVVTPDLRPVSISVLTSRASGEVKITGGVSGETLIIRRESNGLSRSAGIDLKQRSIFGTVLADTLSQMKSEAATLAVIDEETLRTEVAKCRVVESTDPSEVVWEVEIGSDVVLSRGRLTLKGGEREREEFWVPQYNMLRSSREEAEQIKHLTLEGRDILMFDVDQPIARIDLLPELTLFKNPC